MVLPYLKGFYNKVVFFYIVLLYCVFSCGLLYSGIWYLTSGIRALSLGRHCGQIFFIFADFFSEKKKEGRDIPDIFSIFL
jgi:hypothetical protein